MKGREKCFFYFSWREEECDDRDSESVVRAADWIRTVNRCCVLRMQGAL